MKRFLILFALSHFFGTDIALSYPEMVRLNYNGSCQACHVSPTGGGVLTNYGRTVSEEMSSWSQEGVGALLAGAVPETPETLYVGGDTRYVRITTPDFAKSFLMQNDWEVTAQPTREMAIDVSAGRYGDDGEIESRRNYLLWTPSDYFSARVGKFMPAYGLLVADHTSAHRQGIGFDQGRETYNFELGFHGERGQLFLTSAMPPGATLTLQNDPTYKPTAASYSYLARGSYYIGQTAQAGVSYRLTALPEKRYHHTGGVFGMWGIDRDTYFLGEWDRDFEFYKDVKDIVYSELGCELFHGVHVQATYEYIKSSRPGLALQLFPVPHIELLARVKYQDGAMSSVLMFHSNW